MKEEIKVASQSMTGYAQRLITVKTIGGGTLSVAVNIKSFNARYFETTTKIPSVFSFCEIELLKKLKNSLFRGNIYVTFFTENQTVENKIVRFSDDVVTGYVHALEEIKKKFKLTDAIDLKTITLLPSLFIVQDPQIDEASLPRFWEQIDQLIAEVVSSRRQEGSSLQQDMCIRFRILSNEIEQIARLSCIALELQKSKIQQLLQETPEDLVLLENKKNALYASLDKMDIHEEIIRFKTHLQTAEAHLRSSHEEKGKKVDFLLQELSREINTITAKCADADIISHGITVKVELEKLREQAQNLV